MGRRARYRPARLGGKLLRIRELLGLNQEEMTGLLGVEGVDRSYMSRWERSELEPDLRVLLRYAEIANVYLEVLADDRLDIPVVTRLPCKTKSNGVPLRSAKGRAAAEKSYQP